MRTTSPPACVTPTGCAADCRTPAAPAIRRRRAPRDLYRATGSIRAAATATTRRWIRPTSEPSTPSRNPGRAAAMSSGRPGDRPQPVVRPRKGVNIVNYDDYITRGSKRPGSELGRGDSASATGAARRRRAWRHRPGGGGGGGPQRHHGRVPLELEHAVHSLGVNPRTLYLGANHLFKKLGSGRQLADRQD